MGSNVRGIFFALVSRGTTVLAECNPNQGNVGSIVMEMLPKLSDTRQGHKNSYLVDGHEIHVLCDHGLFFICAAPSDFGRATPFSMLQDVAMAFLQQHRAKSTTALAYELDVEFSPVLQQKMEQYNDPRADKVKRVYSEVESLRQVMVSNVENVLERGDRLEILVNKTDNLDHSAVVFKRGASEMKRTMWWQEKKAAVAVVGICVMILYGLSASLCGVKLDMC